MTNNFCSNCGEPVSRPDAYVCTNCGKPLRMTQTESDSFENDQNTADWQEQNYNEGPDVRKTSNYDEARSRPIVMDSKSPFFAAILSFLWVGMGQLYNGKFWKGLFLNICCVVGYLLILPGLAVWIYAMWDAYNEAEKMNRGEIPFSEPSFWEIMVFLFFWIIILLILLVLFFGLLMVSF